MKKSHELFVANYLKSKNASEAARLSGYSQRSASVQGSRLLKNPYVSAAIAAGSAQSVKKSAAKAQLTADRVMEELVNIATFDPATLYGEDGELLPVKNMPEETRRALAGIEETVGARGDKSTKLRISSKLGSLELASKLLGMIREQAQTQAAVQIIIAPHPELPVRVDTTKMLPEW